MPAIISGIVFVDVNRNASFAAGAPGIANVFLTLKDPNNNCTQIQTLSNGSYFFTGLTIPGAYRVYETVITANACPPTVFTQPAPYNLSTTQRVLDVTVTQADIDNSITLANQNFGHLYYEPMDCPTVGLQVALNPAHFYTINVVSGLTTDLGIITPRSPYNAFGYNVINNILYGNSFSSGRFITLNFGLIANTLAFVRGANDRGYNVGDVDLDGHMYLYNTSATSYYVVDVNPNSGTYLKTVLPSNNFEEDPTASPLPITPIGISDWAFNPVDGQLYCVTGAPQVIRINPITMAQTPLITSGFLAGGGGACFFDASGNFYSIDNTTGIVARIVLTNTTATGTAFSRAAIFPITDGARCPLAAIDLLSITKAVDKSVAKVLDNLTYTIVVKNLSNIAATNIMVTDAIPSGTTFVPGSTKVNGVDVPTNPANGITIGPLLIGGVATINFMVRIGATLPSPNPIPNTARLTYSSGSPTDSNTVYTTVLDGYRGLTFIDDDTL